MAIKYKLYQMNRTFKDGRKDTSNGKWYARAISNGTIETTDLAEIIQRNCSIKKSDVLAVITELTEVLSDKLKESYTVKLNGLGLFKIGIQCKGALEATDFSVSNNVTGVHVNFMPAYSVDSANGNRTAALISGVKLQETAKNAVGVVVD